MSEKAGLIWKIKLSLFHLRPLGFISGLQDSTEEKVNYILLIRTYSNGLKE